MLRLKCDMEACSMKSKERPCALIKEGLAHEVKKNHKGPKRRKKKEKRKIEEDPDLGHE